MNLFIFLQNITTQLAADSTAINVPNQATTQGMSMMELVMKGGFVMIPIGVLFTIALYLFIERFQYISRVGKIDNNFIFTIREMLLSGNVKGATDYCKNNSSPIARLMEKGLSRLGSPIRDIETAIENTARIEIYNMEKNLNFLGAIAAISPMFGFLGTVMGMIRTFYNISTQNNLEIGTIAGGIYEKMVTSATGLIVGIIAYVFYTILNTMIERSINRMEVTAIDFLDILHKPVK